MKKFNQELKDRPWYVVYSLIYDLGDHDEWTQYYRTKIGAQISALIHYHIRSWGGTFMLVDNRKKESK